MCNLLLYFKKLLHVFIIIFLIKYLKYQSNTFRTFIKNEDLNQSQDPKQ
jgi:hypothetical protein